MPATRCHCGSSRVDRARRNGRSFQFGDWLIEVSNRIRVLRSERGALRQYLLNEGSDLQATIRTNPLVSRLGRRYLRNILCKSLATISTTPERVVPGSRPCPHAELRP